MPVSKGRSSAYLGLTVAVCIGLGLFFGPVRHSSAQEAPAREAANPAKATGAGEGRKAPPEEAAGVPGVIEKPLSTKSTAHLYEIIVREPPLTKQEVLTYEQNIEAIAALASDPSALPAILETTGWSLERLTYVATKMGVGLSNILYPENPRLKNAQEFLAPTPAERELIVDNLNALVKGYESLSKPKPDPKAKKRAG
jgi:hypothetical protein